MIHVGTNEENTGPVSLRTSSVISKVEPDLNTGSGSDQKVPAPAPQHCLQIPISSKSYTQDNTDNTEFDLTLAIFYRI